MTDTNEILSQQIKEEMQKLEDRKKPVSSEKETTENVVNEVTNESEETTDPYLDEALKSGYDPNYRGPNKKTPEQFVKDGSFFKKIDSLKKENEEIKRILTQQSEHALKVEQAAYEKAIRDLELKKIEAVAQADIEAYQEADIRQRQEHQRFQESQVPAKPTQTQEHSKEVMDFVERNKSWFNNDTPENKLMATAADGLCNLVALEAEAKGEKIDINEQLHRVEERIKRLYPEKFVNEAKMKPKSVASSTVSSGESPKTLANRLSSRQKQFIKQAREYGSKLTEEQYAKQLELTGELRDE